MKFKTKYLRNAARFIRIAARGVAANEDSLGPVALIDARDIDFKRPLLLVARMLRSAGYRVLLRASVRTMLKAGEYGIRIFDDKDISLCLGDRGADLLVSNGYKNSVKNRKNVALNFDVFSRRRGEGAGLFFPIMFHPDFLNERSIARVESMPFQTARAIGVFFAGNMDKEEYDRPETRSLFHLLTRYQVITALREAFGPDFLASPSSMAELEEGMESGIYARKIVLVDTSAFKIPSGRWFEILSRCSFFLSPPGVVQPYCHNTVEAMSVGAVPILQYPDYYDPPLTDGWDCVSFTDERSLKEVLARMLMDSGMTSELGIHARRYYEEYLSPAAFRRALDDFRRASSGSTDLYVCQNTLSVALFYDYLKKAGNDHG